ncbi:hypothetical protein DBZ36_19990 [Alginatibacterium sediminis]|uniref:LPS-assembly lipoprotein LptE n=1 Tax=Alginatibacterium sediminis TaxID=2164068 RepID=A0A420E5Y9_9ALTE|nr:LPS assembly lipoprotein LptE [Alginatibacterium sediminis]RKF12755.1 hypothetical protein DBZ36_19990 [Alginatibacterium sediminis]
MSIKAVQIVFVSIVIATLSGCGFQLRGDYLMSEELNRMYVSGGEKYSPIHREVRRRLELNGTQLMAEPSDDYPTLRLGRVSRTKRTLSLYENGQVAEYEMSYRINSSLISPKHNNQVYPINVKMHRDFQDNPLSSLAKQREEDMLDKEINGLAADQIIRQLAAIQFD